MVVKSNLSSEHHRRKKARMADLSLFREVEAGLEKNSVGWENSVNSLSLAYRHFEAEETQRFLSRCLSTIVSILLDQHPGRIEAHQRQCIEKSLHYSVHLLLLLIRPGQEDAGAYLDTVMMLFNKKRTFYKGGGTMGYWNSMPGAPEVRTKCIAQFAEERGFESVLALLRTPGRGWVGAESAKSLLQAVMEARSTMASDSLLPLHLCVAIMEPLSRLSEEELKKESTEAMSALINLIRRIMEAEDHEGFFQFWLSLTLTYIRSSSLPLRLFAWDQMVELIEVARKARPPARRYLVKGAGVDYANGYYEHVRDRNGAPEYQRDCGNGIVLTLFRCQMRSRSKWWFLSEADKDQPGTDKDIDYYQHRSSSQEEQEPNPTGWITCSSSSARGKDPPPLLERLEPLCEPGQEEATLEHQLKAWVLTHKVVEDVFGASMHREVVNRSAAALKFLAGMKALDAEQLDMIWKSCLGKAEAELVEEIHNVLSALITSLSPDLVVHLLDGVRASIRDGAIMEAVALAEKLAQVSLTELGQLGQRVLDSLLLLLWDLLQQPAIRQHKAYDTINEVLAQALRQVSESTRQYAFLEQSLEVVRRSAADEGQAALDFDELAVINALQMTHFLLDVFEPTDKSAVIEQLTERQKLPELLFQELAAFKRRCNLRAQAGRQDPSSVLEERIKLRLDVLRYVHAFSEKVQLSFPQVVAIWGVLDSPAEKELGMAFLTDACRAKQPMQNAFSLDVIVDVFRDLICQRADWTVLGERAYGCFNYYFEGLRKRETEEVRTVGLDALWRIALTAKTQTVAEAATKDLLNVYGEGGGDVMVAGGGSRLQFLKRIFEHLAACREELRLARRSSAGIGNNGSSNGMAETTLKAERCLRLLQGAVGNSKQANAGGDQPLPHGWRGEAGRRCIMVEPRKIMPQSAGVGQARSQPAQRLEVVALMMHPLETVGVLRRRVAQRCDHPLAQIRLMCTGKPLKDDVTIQSSGLAEGSEIQAILMPPKIGQQQQQQPTPTFGPEEAPSASSSSSTLAGAAMAVGPPAPPLSPTGGSTALVGDLISREDSYCSILFDLLLECGTNDATLSAAIWELLLAIPTQVHALELVKLTAMGSTTTTTTAAGEEAGGEGGVRGADDDDDRMSSSSAEPPQWSSLISPLTWDRSVYYLQIVDFLLQPSEDMAAAQRLPEGSSSPALAGVHVPPAREFLRALVRTGGFSHILEVFMHTGGDSTIQGMATAVALRIVKFCLFGQQQPQSPRADPPSAAADDPAAETEEEDDVVNGGSNGSAMMPVDADDMVVDSVDPTRLLGGSKRLRPLLDRLVTVAAQTHLGSMAGAGAEEGSWQVTVDALATIEMLLRQPGMASSLLENPSVKELFMSILLRDPSAKVRSQLAQLILAKEAEPLAPSFFQWGLEALEGLEPECTTCQQFFDVLQRLARDPPPTSLTGSLLTSLARIVTDKLAAFPRVKEATEKRHQVLRGYLRLLRELVGQDRDNVLFKATKLEQLIPCAMYDMLFAVPAMDAKDNRPICAHTDTESRQLVFLTLQALVKRRQEELHRLLAELFAFTEKGADGLRNRWGYECSFDAKATPTQYVGLRNQGCTCYMNSLLQQLFMIPQLRDALMAARVKRRRTIPVQRLTDEELVGQRIVLHWESSTKTEAQVTDFDRRTGKHVIKHEGSSSNSSDEVVMDLREARPDKKEMPVVEVVPPPKRFSPQVAHERELTQRVLEQVQRTFCYLQWSEKRFFDPRPLVEACKCLNLNYSVYQQNDASEFCDKLLDKLEAALKGGPQARELQMCFGGKFANQKIPQDCEHRTEIEEPFIKVELIIRGKDSIQESLAAFVEGEMMDGENKVECEKCNTKKVIFRRTCLSQLPNVLILHLKRFDLDFSTFETVKLNNRCAFPMRLNMKPYTREGLEEAARAKAAEEAEDDDSSTRQQPRTGGGGGGGGGREAKEEEEEGAAVPMVLDDGDYEYELKGVVIHAGVAQGGHYYSFIKDRSRPATTSAEGGQQEAEGDAWFRFDDEDVQAFDPTHIEQYCFGGTTVKTNTWNGVTSTIEQERVANALMLFYEKVRPRTVLPDEEQNRATAQAAAPEATAGGPVEEGRLSGDGMVMASPATAVEAADEGEGEDVVKMEVGPEPAAGPNGGDHVDKTSPAAAGEGAAPQGSSSGEEGKQPPPEQQAAAGEDDSEDFEFGEDGRSAFEEEVWHANVSFIYHSYLFDQQLHAFLSGLLAMAFTLPATPDHDAQHDHPVADQPMPGADPAAADGSSRLATGPQAMRLSPAAGAATSSSSSSLSLGLGVDPALANPGPPLWDPWSESQRRVRMDVFRLGVLFLFDVILHSRERPGIQAWVTHLKQAMRSDPATASYLVQVLTASPWLRTYFLDCSDSTARSCVQQLVVWAVLELASREDEAAALALPVAEAVERSQVAALLTAVMGLLVEANKFWRHTDELFVLFRDTAKQSEVVRDFLVRADLVYRLALFVLGERAPPALRGPHFPLHWPQEGMGHHGHDLLYLLETIVVLVGVPQVHKVALLEEPAIDHASAQDYRLTPAARQALCQIFQQYQRQGSMGMQEIMRYLDHCNSTGQPVTHFQIKNMLQKYDTTPDHRLTQAGFLTYYRDTAVYSAKSVWQDLYMHGFRNDLSQGRMPAEYDLGDLSALPRLRLPQLSQLALSLTSFYIPTFDVLWTETGGVLTRVCMDNLESSVQLIHQINQDIHQIISHYGMPSHHPQLSTDTQVHMLSVLLNIEDAYMQDRHDAVFFGDHYGVVRVLLNKYHRALQNPQDYSLKQHVYHYVHLVVQELFQKHHVSRRTIETRRPKEWAGIVAAYRLTYDQSGGGGGGGGGNYHGSSSAYYGGPFNKKSGADSDEEEEEEDDSADWDEFPVVRVQGAGHEPVNGIYRRKADFEDAHVYELKHEDGRTPTFTLYRCKLDTGDYRWYISIVPQNQMPGTQQDKDFYYAYCKHPEEDMNPPEAHWKCCVPTYDPPPTLQFVSMDEDSDEADAGSPQHLSPRDDGSDNDDMTPTPQESPSPSHPGHGAAFDEGAAGDYQASL